MEAAGTRKRSVRTIERTIILTRPAILNHDSGKRLRTRVRGPWAQMGGNA
jgi:hypothetical protein